MHDVNLLATTLYLRELERQFAREPRAAPRRAAALRTAPAAVIAGLRALLRRRPDAATAGIVAHR